MGGADRDIDPDCHRNRAGCDELYELAVGEYDDDDDNDDENFVR